MILFVKIELEKVYNMKEESASQIASLVKSAKLLYQKDLSVYDRSFLLRSAVSRQQYLGIVSLSEYIARLCENDYEARTYFNYLRNTYSQFIREPLAFSYLEDVILPALLKSKKADSMIRIWSVGCSTGQEAYSVAIYLYELQVKKSIPIRFQIFATDVDTYALEKARTGRYSAADVQNVPLKYISKYFNQEGDCYNVDPQIKQNISFSEFDLLDELSCHPPDSIYGDFDIIFCCNLLLYYGPEARGIMINKLKKAAVSRGYIITSKAEKVIVESEINIPPVAVHLPIFRV